LVWEKDNMVMRETDLGCPNIYCQHNSLRLAEDNIVLREPEQLFILGFALNNET
jgi:soluble P-type ATPase